MSNVINDQLQISNIKLHGYKIQLDVNQKGMPVARKMKMMFSGKNKGQYKTLEGYYFQTEERRAERVKQWVKEINDQQTYENNRKAETKAARENMKHGYEVGQILYNSWGYDQTNIDFYQIIEVKAKSIVIQEIGSKSVNGTAGHDSVNVVPDPDIKGHTFKKVIQVKNYGSGISYRIHSTHGSFSEYKKGDAGVYSSWGH